MHMRFDNILYFLLSALAVLLAASCSDIKTVPQAYSSAELSDLRITEASHYLYRDSLGIKLKATDRDSMLTDDVVLSKDNQGAILIGKSEILDLKTNVIDIDIVVDNSIGDIEVNQAWINSVLSKLNTGLQVRLTLTNSDLSSVETDGKRNTDKLAADLNPQKKYTAYLFESSSFFSTANAVSIRVNERTDSEKVLILGNAYLLQSPYLFVHELLHGFGLTHHNEMYEMDAPCAHSNAEHMTPFFNVMHESNVGCARRLAGRQIMILNEDTYFPPVVGDPLFPDDNACGCNFTGLGNPIERYLNGFDTNIDDTALSGDDVMLLDYLATSNGNILPLLIETVLRENFTAEAMELGIASASYVDLRIETLKLQRTYNLSRWIRENMEVRGIAVSDTNWNMTFDATDTIEFDTLVDMALGQIAENQCAMGCSVMIGAEDICDMLRPREGDNAESVKGRTKNIRDKFLLSYTKPMLELKGLKESIKAKLKEVKDGKDNEIKNPAGSDGDIGVDDSIGNGGNDGIKDSNGIVTEEDKEPNQKKDDRQERKKNQ